MVLKLDLEQSLIDTLQIMIKGSLIQPIKTSLVDHQYKRLMKSFNSFNKLTINKLVEMLDLMKNKV